MLKNTVNIAGQNYEYFVDGEGNIPLICVHGWAASYINFLQAVPLLSKHFKIYLFDFPGNYDAPRWQRDYYMGDYIFFLKEFIEKLGLKDFYLLGESFGSLVALRYLLEKENHVRGVILISLVMNVPSKMEEFWAKMLSKVSESPILGAIISLLKGNYYFENYWISLLIDKKSPYYNEIQKITMDELKRVDAKTYIQGYISILESNTPALLDALFSKPEIDKIIIYGRYDPFSKWSSIENVNSISEIVVVDDCRHSPHLEKPEIFYNVLEEHFLHKLTA